MATEPNSILKHYQRAQFFGVEEQLHCNRPHLSLLTYPTRSIARGSIFDASCIDLDRSDSQCSSEPTELLP